MNLLRIFEITVSSSLIGSIIVLMMLIIKWTLKSKLNPAFHYYLWLILLIKLIIPFGPQTPLSFSTIYNNFSVQSTVNENTQITALSQSENTALDNSISINSHGSSHKNTAANPAEIPSKTKVNAEKIFCIIWMLGVLFLTGVFALAYIRLREIVGTSIENTDSRYNEILHCCLKTMNIKNDLKIFYSSKVSSPSLCGFIKPKILIPVGVIGNVREEEFKHIIMHELSHLKHKDIFINWVITLLSVIYWFNPILLYGFHKMRQDCEFYCDNQVISYLNESGNIEYGNTIIHMLKLSANGKKIMGTTSMIMNISEIKRRLTMISKYKKLNAREILLGIAVAAIVGGLAIAVNVSNMKENKHLVKAPAAALQSDTAPITDSKNIINNTAKETASSILKGFSNDNAEVITPFSSDIVIYNSHPDEDYPSGAKVTDTAALINHKLIKAGLKSRFIKCNTPAEYVKSFQASRDVITKNVKQYSNTILLDIHRDVKDTSNSNTKKLLFTLAKNNPHYKENEKFVVHLIENIKNSSGVKADILFYANGISYFNQDLSNNSVLIEVGNDMSSDSDIEECVDALVSALKS